MLNETIGKNIRKERLALNWTQERLAKTLCISHQIISKWENGIAAPDIRMLCSLSKIFGVSVDALCGMSVNDEAMMISEINGELNNADATYPYLMAKWESIESELFSHPLSDALYDAALKYLRFTHDRITSDAQLEEVNALILNVAERILDFSSNDHYRSYANLNLALYYHEQIRFAENEYKDIYSSKAKKCCDLVLYKDMPRLLYHRVGEPDGCDYMLKNISELLDCVMMECKNLNRYYKRKGDEVSAKSIISFWNGIEEKKVESPILSGGTSEYSSLTPYSPSFII